MREDGGEEEGDEQNIENGLLSKKNRERKRERRQLSWCVLVWMSEREEEKGTKGRKGKERGKGLLIETDASQAGRIGRKGREKYQRGRKKMCVWCVWVCVSVNDYGKRAINYYSIDVICPCPRSKTTTTEIAPFSA